MTALHSWPRITSITSATAAFIIDVLADSNPATKSILGADLYSDILAVNHPSVVVPSGDDTGATDRAAIQAALDDTGTAILQDGTYYIDDSILLTVKHQAIRGVGYGTVIRPGSSAGSIALIKVIGDGHRIDATIASLQTIYGLYGIHMTDCSGLCLDNVKVNFATSHGIYLSKTSEDGAYIFTMLGGMSVANGGDGINSVSGASSAFCGNAMNLYGVNLEENTGAGLVWSAVGLGVFGCTIEGNDEEGIRIVATDFAAHGFNILGNYFELNDVAEIHLQAGAVMNIDGGSIMGNMIQADTTYPNILFSQSGGGSTSRIQNITVAGNDHRGSSGTTRIVAGNIPYRCTFEDLLSTDHDMSASRQSNNRIMGFAKRNAVTTTFKVTCNADKTAAQPTLVTLPTGSVIHEITAHTYTAMNGTGTKTFEVGVSGNTDKYIDPDDFHPETLNNVAAMISGTNNDQKTTEVLTADTTLLATWTNTGGTPSAGVVHVTVTYSEFPGFYTKAIAVPD